MGRRNNGNWYERKQYHRKYRNTIAYTNSAKYYKQYKARSERAKVRQALYNTTYDEDWDVYAIGNDGWWDDWTAYCKTSKFGWEFNWEVRLTTEDQRRLPPGLFNRHRWFNRTYQYTSSNTAYRHVHYERALNALKDVYFDHNKMNFMHKNVTRPNVYWGGYSDIPIVFPAYTLLDEWWSKTKYRRATTIALHKLGYDVLTTNRNLSFPPEEE